MIGSRLLPIAVAMAVVSSPAQAESFVMSDIRLEGLARLSAASVYGLMPYAVGDVLTNDRSSEIVQALFASGQFEDVQVLRDGNAIIVRVVERPSVSSIEITGNKSIGTEELIKGLKSIGLAEGEVFKRAALDQVRLELQRQYAAQGRYGATVIGRAKPLPRNRVAVSLEIKEGDTSRIAKVTINGNKAFKDATLLKQLQLRSSRFLSFIYGDDKYSREKLSADLETLRSYYLDRGYLRFNVTSTQVSLSPEKDQVYIDINVEEGEPYKISEVRLAGELPVEEAQLRPLLLAQPGQTYSQKVVTLTNEVLTRRLGRDGYLLAEVQGVPELDDEKKTAAVTFFVNPNRVMTVRRINFKGNLKTDDAVLRREMRQMEGALASNEKIDLSKVRLERTGFFKTVDVKPVRVPNSPDQVDLNVNVEEQHSGTTTLAVGYSQNGGITFQAGLSQTNFMGTGNRVSVDLSRSETQDYYNLSVTDPYFTIDGVSRGYNVYYRKTKLNEDYNVNNYVTDSYGGSLSFGYPIDENQSLSASLGIDKTKVRTGPSVSTYIRDYLLANGGKETHRSAEYCRVELEPIKNEQGEITGYKPCPEDQTYTFADQFEGDFLTYMLNLGWSYNTLNRPIFPTSGMSHRVGLEVGLPGSDVEYQKVTYDAQAFMPLGNNFVLRGYGKLGYGNDLPFYKNFYAGGYGSVRGYENSTLGPKYPSVIFQETGKNDPNLEEVGGNALVQFGTELAIPLPFKGDWTRQVRPVVFAEGAQVFDTQCDVPKGDLLVDGNSVDIKQYCKDNYKFDFGNMRYSVGVGFTWITMIGPLSLSYAYPLNDKKGDVTKSIQFEIGRTF